MNESATSLDRLHDIALPTAVPWWPPAPAWYAVMGILLVLILALAHRAWRRHRANAYRRAALRELASARDLPSIAELLRRTALAIAPREEIARMTGEPWLAWLAARACVVIPENVREQLNSGVYARAGADQELAELREFAAHWIAHHQALPDNTRATQC